MIRIKLNDSSRTDQLKANILKLVVRHEDIVFI